jgi:UDP-glucose 4-epimerase
VREVIAAVEAATGLKVPVVMGERRKGDPVSLVASPGRARAELGWQPHYTSLEQMVAHAWGFLKPTLTRRQTA